MKTLELFTPILDGKRQELHNVRILGGDPLMRLTGIRATIETEDGSRYRVVGRACSLPNCHCDAEIIKQ
jgi:hypothetical protein